MFEHHQLRHQSNLENCKSLTVNMWKYQIFRFPQIMLHFLFHPCPLIGILLQQKPNVYWGGLCLFNPNYILFCLNSNPSLLFWCCYLSHNREWYCQIYKSILFCLGHKIDVIYWIWTGSKISLLMPKFCKDRK